MHDDELDSLIDEALLPYGGEPGVGLEAKILAKAGAVPTVRKMAVASWVGMVAGIAAAIVMGVLVLHHAAQPALQPGREIAMQPTPTHTEQAMPEQTFADTHVQKATVRKHRPLAAAVAPKSSYTEPPMTAQERQLVALAMHQPEVLRPFLATEKKESAPLSIAPLSIAPVASHPLTIEAINTDPLPVDADR